MIILVSACLLGIACKWDGGDNGLEQVRGLVKDHVVIAVCPEQQGGLPTPRCPSEIREGRVVNRLGEDVDGAFRLGSDRIMDMLHQVPIDLAVLKARSPSCGIGKIYDGSFTGKLTDGDGIFAQRLKAAGIPVITEEELVQMLSEGDSYDPESTIKDVQRRLKEGMGRSPAPS